MSTLNVVDVEGVEIMRSKLAATRIPGAMTIAAMVLVGLVAAAGLRPAPVVGPLDRGAQRPLTADSPAGKPTLLLLRPRLDEIVAGLSLEVEAEARGALGRLHVELVQGETILGEADVDTPPLGFFGVSLPLNAPRLLGAAQLALSSMGTGGTVILATRTVRLCWTCG